MPKCNICGQWYKTKKGLRSHKEMWHFGRQHKLTEFETKDYLEEKVLSLYKGDPFPITRGELEQMKGSRALSRQWSRFRRMVGYELERKKRRRN